MGLRIMFILLACMTTTGKKCIFPFKYNNNTHPEIIFDKCSTLDIYEPWCPTSKSNLRY